MLSVLCVGLADELCSSLEQDSSALLPLAKLCLQSLLDLSDGRGPAPPNLAGVSLEVKAALTAWCSSCTPQTQPKFTNHTSLHMPVI